jgi:DnaJ-class molecular chaperone
MYTDKEIVLCSSCKGSGKCTITERYDYHKRYDWEWDEVCDLCGGHGRMIKTTITSFEKLSEKDLNIRPKPLKAE